MGRPSRLFGVELRRRRVQAGHSLDGFARLVHYSKSHLSKVENGVKGPSEDLARLCDAALGCAGALAALVDDGDDSAPRHEASEVPVFDLGPYDMMRSVLASRRDLLATGLLSAAGLAEGAERHAAAEDDLSPLEIFQQWFRQTRELGQRMDAERVMPLLVAHAHTLSLLAADYRGADRRRALALVADYAEYTGWMAQEAGDEQAARWWTDRAVHFAAAAGDDGMAGYALVRRALIAMYQGKAEETVALARQAQRTGCRRRILGLAAQREAQGHAMAYRSSDCLRALDRAREHLAADPPRAREPVIGSAHVPDLARAAAGWSLFDLGEAAEAAAVLGESVRGTPPQATRARARFAARQALALASSGQVEEACAVADRVVDAQAVLRSATIAVDVRRLAVVLRRWPTDPAARRLSLRLHEGRAGERQQG